MGKYTNELTSIAQAVFSPSEFGQLLALATPRLSFSALVEFDKCLGGPSMTAINHNNSGRYAHADRDIFRPLQYCAAIFEAGRRFGDIQWRTRHIVLNSSAHIESLVKRIGDARGLPLGQALHKKLAKMRIDPVTWSQADRFTKIYNASKHEFDQRKDTHLFSVKDAVLAYFISRRLGAALYPLANLATDLAVFDTKP